MRGTQSPRHGGRAHRGRAGGWDVEGGLGLVGNIAMEQFPIIDTLLTQSYAGCPGWPVAHSAQSLGTRQLQVVHTPYVSRAESGPGCQGCTGTTVQES